jgi:hypothetical protein
MTNDPVPGTRMSFKLGLCFGIEIDTQSAALHPSEASKARENLVRIRRGSQ